VYVRACLDALQAHKHVCVCVYVGTLALMHPRPTSMCVYVGTLALMHSMPTSMCVYVCVRLRARALKHPRPGLCSKDHLL